MSISSDATKSSFIKATDTEAMMKAPILMESLPKLGKAACDSNDRLSQFLFVGIVTNLTRSNTDKDKLRRVPGMPMWDDQQMEQAQMLLEKMPKEGRPAANGEFERGDDSLVAGICSSLVESDCFKYCCNILKSEKGLSCNLASQAGRAIYQVVFKGDTKTQGQLIKWGAFKAMLNAVSVLAYDKKWLRSADDDIKDLRHALARLAMSVDPTSLSYGERLNLTPQMLHLMESSHELHVYEALLVLTNLTSGCSTCRERVLVENGFNHVSNAAMADNMRVRQAGIELMANLTQSDTLLDQISQGRWVVELNFLLLCLSEYGEEGIIKAAGGALAMMSNDVRVGLRLLYRCDKINSLIEALMAVVASKDDAIAQRIRVIWTNVLQSGFSGFNLEGVEVESQREKDLVAKWKQLFPLAEFVIKTACEHPEQFQENDVAIKGMRKVRDVFLQLVEEGQKIYGGPP